MPKATEYCLSWSQTHSAYELSEGHRTSSVSIPPHQAEWWAWLATVPSFTFLGKQGQLTVRQELRQRGGIYWYAYRRVGSKMTKRYLGKTNTITLERLEEIAHLLGAATKDGENVQQITPTPVKALAALATSALSSASAAQDWETTPSSNPLPQTPIQKRPEPELLVATKFHPPRLRSRLLGRAHLLARLHQVPRYSLTLLSAPAGFGKTTILAQWITDQTMPVAWLSLDPNDNDPGRFLTSVIAALHKCIPALGMTMLNLRDTPHAPSAPHVSYATPLENAFTVLTNDLMARDIPNFAMVLDDYHVITLPAIHQALTFLVDHLPPQMHLILASRTDPPLPLARLRAKGHLLELRTDLLRLKSAEVTVFVREVNGLDLPPTSISALEHRTEGWVAGLQLAALSLQDCTDVPAFLTTFTGKHRFVFDYLFEEVLSRQSEPIQTFMLYTSILERLCGSLCQAVSGHSDGAMLLEAVERENLFVVALDDDRHWYRYHSLFADVLKNRLTHLQPEVIPELHRRASVWYEQHGLLFEAVQHALLAHNIPLSVRLIERAGYLPMAQGRPGVLLEWVKALPEAVVRAHPLLCAGFASALHVMDQLEEAEAWLQAAENAVSAATRPDVAKFILGNAASIRANFARYVGDMPRFVSLVQHALEVWPETVFSVNRAILMVQIAYSFLESGETTPTIEQQVRTAAQLVLASGYRVIYYRSLALLARFHLLQGQLKLAATIFEQADLALPGDVLQVLAGKASHYFGLGDLWREWDRLDEAEHLLRQGVEQVRGIRSCFADEVFFGYLTLARVLHSRGQSEQAVAILEEFMQLADLRGFVPRLKATALAFVAQIALDQGHSATALRWADESGVNAQAAVISYSYPREREYLILARIRIWQGRSNPAGFFLQAAQHLLERLLEEAEAKMRQSSILEIYVLQALALHARHNLVGALTILERALTIAEPEGYVRLFVDEGKPMQRLLKEAQNLQLAPKYVATLLAAFSESEGAIMEPLTSREQEILQLLAKGAPNSEIASYLVLSLSTVKKYVSLIYGKLGVKSRTQALIKARSLHLL